MRAQNVPIFTMPRGWARVCMYVQRIYILYIIIYGANVRSFVSITFTSFQGTLKYCFQYLVNDHFYPVQNEVLITCVPVRNHSMFAILRYFRIVMNFGDNGIALSK